MKLNHVLTLSFVLSGAISSAAMGAIDVPAGKQKITFGGAVRVSLTQDDQGQTKTTGSDPKALTDIAIDRSDLKLGFQATDRMRFDFVLQPHNIQRDRDGVSAAVETATMSFKFMDALSLVAGIQLLNIGGVENIYDITDVYHYTSWYNMHACGTSVACFVPAIAPVLTLGPVVATVQLGDRPALDTPGGKAIVDPAIITGRVDVNLVFGSTKVTPVVQVASLANTEKQMSFGVMADMGAFGGDVNFSQSTYAKNHLSMASTASDGSGKARAVTSPEVFLRFTGKLVGGHTLTPWIKWSSMSDDYKENGTAPKAMQAPKQDLFVGVSHGFDALTTTLSYAAVSGDFYEGLATPVAQNTLTGNEKVESRTQGKITLFLTGKF